MIKRNAKAVIAAGGPILGYAAAAVLGEFLGIWAIIIGSAAAMAVLTWVVPNEAE